MISVDSLNLPNNSDFEDKIKNLLVTMLCEQANARNPDLDYSNPRALIIANIDSLLNDSDKDMEKNMDALAVNHAKINQLSLENPKDSVNAPLGPTAQLHKQNLIKQGEDLLKNYKYLESYVQTLEEAQKSLKEM